MDRLSYLVQDDKKTVRYMNYELPSFSSPILQTTVVQRTASVTLHSRIHFQTVRINFINSVSIC